MYFIVTTVITFFCKPLGVAVLSYIYGWPYKVWITYAILLLLWLLVTPSTYSTFKVNGRQWKKDVIVITGGSNGLGLELAEQCASKGAKVVSLDICPRKIDNVISYICDVSDEHQVEETFEKIRKDVGDPTVLINNAAVVSGKHIQDLHAADLRKTFETNLFSSIYTINQCITSMKEKKFGNIVHISSSTAHVAPAQTFDYSASKAGILCLHDCLLAELGGYNQPVTVLLVTLGQMATKLFEGVKTPSPFFAPIIGPEEIAASIVLGIGVNQGGEVAFPLYARWVGVLRLLPASINRILRYLSGADLGMKTFKQTRG